MDEVARSIRVGSTPLTEPFADRRRLGFALGGFVAGEGCFSSRVVAPRSPSSAPRHRFTFTLTVADRDREVVAALHEMLDGVGSVYSAPARQPGWQPTVSLQITAMRDHLVATIPFAEQFLLPVGRKHRQFLAWRDRLHAHRRAQARRLAARPVACSTPGCGRAIRARGLCRGCYWRATGN